MSRLDVLNDSLAKKKQIIDQKLDRHFADVKSANGQPLNDKRNGDITLNRWERQSESIKSQLGGIEKTKQAINREQLKIDHVQSIGDRLPKIIIDLLESGQITQWRKFPNRFFVVGVEKARLIVDLETQIISYGYLSEIKDKTQYAIFRDLYNMINNTHNKLI